MEQLTTNQLSRLDIQDDTTWQLMTRFVLRSPGFPFAWLEQLQFPESVALAKQLLIAQAHQQQLKSTFAEEIFPLLCDEEMSTNQDKKVFRFWYRLARSIRCDQPISPLKIEHVRQYDRLELVEWLQNWSETCEQLRTLWAKGEETFKSEIIQKRQVLYQQVIDARFQEALWLSNPSIYEVGWHYFNRHWDLQHRPSKIKHIERHFYTYLQRFCAKNDTTSFFGPLNYGRFDEQGPDFIQTETRIRGRQVFLAYWAAEALASRIAAEPSVRPYLCPRRNPLRRYKPSDEVTATLYHLCDGEQSIIVLAHCLQQQPAEMLATVEELVIAGWLYLDLPIPPTLLDPLGYLAGKIRSLPSACIVREHWLETLIAFQQACAHFTTADLPTRQSILSGLETQLAKCIDMEVRRGQGKIFQDRTVLYEECLGNLEVFHLSESQRQHITKALKPIAALCATYAQLKLADLQSAGHALFDDLSPTRTPIPFITFITAWHRRYPSQPPSPASTQLQQRFTELVARHNEGQLSQLSAADLDSLCQFSTEPIIMSPDLLLAAPNWDAVQAGRYQVVIGEIHHGLQSVGWMLTFVEDRESWECELSEHLPTSTDTTTPANLIFGRRMKTAPPEFVGPSVQAPAISARPPRLDLNDLVVEFHCKTSLCLRTRKDQKELRFYPPSYQPPESLYAPFACFSYPLPKAIPIQLGEHTPRIEIEGTVYQRERWDLSTNPLLDRNYQGTTYQLVIDFLRFKERLGLPRHIFAQTPTEPKPIYIDLHNYFALELLAHLMNQTDTISLVEMYPTPQQLWMQNDDGCYTSELRTVLSNRPRRVLQT